jgi:hypothetical protein
VNPVAASRRPGRSILRLVEPKSGSVLVDGRERARTDEA